MLKSRYLINSFHVWGPSEIRKIKELQELKMHVSGKGSWEQPFIDSHETNFCETFMIKVPILELQWGCGLNPKF